MKKCLRCGKENPDDAKVCPDCEYEFIKLDSEAKPEYKYESDLKDYPIFGFIFSVVGMILPIFIFSIVGILMSKKPAQNNLKPFKMLALVFGITGIVLSVGFVSFLVYFKFIKR